MPKESSSSRPRVERAPRGLRVAAAALAVYAGLLAWTGRAIDNEDWDGVRVISNCAALWGAASEQLPAFDVKRPPLGWLAVSPGVAWAYARGGPRAAMSACRALMPLVLAAAVLLSWRALARFFPPWAALIAAGLLACNPIALQFAPFALVDIFAMLAVPPFLWASWRFLQAPSARAWVLAFAAYLAAFLSKYHLGLLVLAPIAYGLLAAGGGGALRRLRAAGLSPFWLMPPLCWAVSVGALGLLVWAADGGGWGAWRQAHEELAVNFSFNLLAGKRSSALLYLEALWRQLGPGLGALAALGLAGALRERRGPLFYAATALLLGYGALLFGIANKEARYAIPLLPLVYGALAAGLARAERSFGPEARSALVAGALLLHPWGEAAAALRYLREEPSVHGTVWWSLAAELERRVPEGRCVGWVQGDALIPIQDRLFRYEPFVILGAPTFRFFLRRPVKELRVGSDDGTVCDGPLRWVVVPREGPGGPRWPQADPARVYELAPERAAAAAAETPREGLRWVVGLGADGRAAL